MNRKLSIALLIFVIALASVTPAFAKGRGNGALGVIYVTSQGLYYDTFATADTLPPVGRFQKLEVVNGQPQTEFGPGTPGYLGGRWWLDVNGNNVMDLTDTYFDCPLLGPGRTTP